MHKAVIHSHNSGLCNQLYAFIGAIYYAMSNNIHCIFIPFFKKSIHTNTLCLTYSIINIPLYNQFLSRSNIPVTIITRPVKMKMITIPYTTNFHHANICKTNNTTLFNNLLSNIFFRSLAPMPYIPPNFNLIHIRLEEDALNHWANMNSMNTSTFKEIVSNKYIDLIKSHVSKSIPLVILSSDYNNNVISFLKTNGYIFTYVRKRDECIHHMRELCAIMDLIVARHAKPNSIFIGNAGSTFSETIKIMNPHLNTLEINLNNVK